MSHSRNNESFFNERLNAEYEQRAPDFSKSLNIAIIGKVSTGKSSLLNAFLRRTRSNMIAEVGAISGVTTNLKIFRLDDRIRIIDSPGLDDINANNSQITKEFIKHIDVGLFVVTGSADVTQKNNLTELQQTCDAVFVVLNKIDDWDRHGTIAKDKVLQQWRKELGIDKIYPTCAFGYDPDIEDSVQLDIRGVDDLRDAVEHFLASQGKDLLLARQMGEKQSYAIKIIVASLLSVAGEAFLPGSAVFITATQAAAICSLYYLYTGRVLSKQSALATIPAFVGQAAGMNLFLWVESLLPPNGLTDVAAAGVAIVITLAMLLTVNSLLASGHELHERSILQSKFRDIHNQAKKTLHSSSVSDWKSSDFWREIIRQLMYL